MTREHQPRSAKRRAAEVGIVGLGVAGGAFLLSDTVGAQEVGKTPVVWEQLGVEDQSLFDVCAFMPSDLYTARGYTSTNELTEGGERAGENAALFAVTTPKKDQGIMAFARECLGVTKDTPDPVGTVRATVGALTKQIGVDSQLENPNDITDETPLTLNMTLIADMRRHIGTAPEAKNPKPETPQSPNPKTSEPTVPQPETAKTPDTSATTYTVTRGDWLGKIAKDHGTTVEAIKAANPGIDPNLILVNQILNIPHATAPENIQVNRQPAVERHLDQQEDQPAFLTTEELLREMLDEVAANSTDTIEKTALKEAQIIRRDDVLTPEQLNAIAAQMGDESIQLLIAPTTTSQEAEAGAVITLDSGGQATTMQANLGETCLSDAKWVIGCTVVTNAPPVIILILREQSKKGGPSPLMRQIVGTYDLHKQRQAERAAKALSQLQSDAERLGGTGAGYAFYNGIPILIDAQGDLVTDANGQLVRITTSYQKPQTVTPSAQDSDLIAHIQRGDNIHLVRSTDSGIDAIAREHIQVLLKNKELTASDEDVATLTAIWAAAIIGANGNDIITPDQALYLPSPESLSPFSAKLAGLAAQKNTNASSHLSQIMNEGGGGGEPFHLIVDSFMTDPTLAYLMRDTGTYLLTSKLIEGAISAHITDPAQVGQIVREAYASQYADHIKSAANRPRDEAIRYLVDIAKADPQTAAEIIDQAQAGTAPDTLGNTLLQKNADRYTAVKSAAKQADMAPTPSAETRMTYTVASGDTLYTLAKKHGTTVEALMQANGLVDPHALQVGQILQIPNTQQSTSITMSENMGPGAGGPEDEFSRIRSQIIDPAARMYMELFPDQTRTLLEAHTQSSIHEIQTILYSAYQHEVETQLQLDANANEQDLVTRLQGLTNVPIDPYRQFLINNSHDANIMVNYLTDVIPAYAQIAPQAMQSKDLLARLKPEVFLENDLTNDLNSQEVVRIAFTMIEDEIVIMSQHMQRGLPPPAEVQESYATLADLMGKTILDNMLQLEYAQGNMLKQTLDIITTGASRYKQRVEGTLPEGIRSTLTPEQAYQVIESWNTDPVARMYMEAHHDEAAALIYESLAQQNHDMQTIVNSLVTQATATLRSELAGASTEVEHLAAIQRQATFDISPYQSELLQTSEQGRITETLETLAFDAADYDQIRTHVEENEEAFARIDIATYDERMGSSLSRPEAIQQIYHIIEHRIREGAVDLTLYGQITDPTVAATYQNIQRLWGAKPLQDWVATMEQEGIDTHPSAEIVDMIDRAYTTFLDNKELRVRRPRLTDSPAALNESAPYEAPAPDDTDMNRADHAADPVDNTAGGAGNGVAVQGGDTMTQPIAEPDHRGDNAIDTPPTGYTNPSDYNPDGTPITPPGLDAMESPMITPDMANSTASQNNGLTAEQAAALAMSDAPTTEGSTGTVSAPSGGGGGSADKKSDSPLSMDQVYQIIQKDGAAIEAHIQEQNDKFGPDPLTQMADLNNYIQAHPEELQRTIQRQWEKLHPDQQYDTHWIWEDIDPETQKAVIKAIAAAAAVAAAAVAAVANTASGSGA